MSDLCSTRDPFLKNTNLIHRIQSGQDNSTRNFRLSAQYFHLIMATWGLPSRWISHPSMFAV